MGHPFRASLALAVAGCVWVSCSAQAELISAPRPVKCDQCTCHYDPFPPAHSVPSTTHTVPGANFDKKSCYEYCEKNFPTVSWHPKCKKSLLNHCITYCPGVNTPTTNCSRLPNDECPTHHSNFTCHATLYQASLPLSCTSCKRCACYYALGLTITQAPTRATNETCKAACLAQTKGTGYYSKTWHGDNCPNDGTGHCTGPPPPCTEGCVNDGSVCHLRSFYCAGGTRCKCKFLHGLPDTEGCEH